MFLTKRAAAFWFGGEWFISSIPMEEHQADNVGWDFLPVINNGYEKQTCGGIGSALSVSASTKYPEIAIDILKSFNSPEAKALSVKNGIITPGATDAKSDIPLFNEMIEIQSTWNIGFGQFGNFAVQEAVFTELQELLLGKSVDEVILTIQEKTDKILATKE